MPRTAITVLCTLVLVVLACRPTPELTVFGPAPSFSLTDDLDRPFSPADVQGRVVLADFIFTNCQDICPVLSVRMQALQSRLRQDDLLGSRVQLLSFTVDPARDTPSVLRAYAERHQADPSAWRFLTGPQEQVIPLIVQGFHLGTQALPPKSASPVDAMGEHGTVHGDGHAESGAYDVLHSGRFVLIDRDWQVRAYYDGTEVALDQIVEDIRRLAR